MRTPDTPKERRLEDQGFRIWLDLGESRSFSTVAETMGLRVTDVIKHARQFQWNARLRKTIEQAKKDARGGGGPGDAQSLAEINKRHLEHLREGIEKAMTVIRSSVDTMKPSEAVSLLKTCVALERQVTGADGKQEDQRAVLTELIRELTGGRKEAVKKLKLKEPDKPKITVEPADPADPVDGAYEFELDPELSAETDSEDDGSELER